MVTNKTGQAISIPIPLASGSGKIPSPGDSFVVMDDRSDTSKPQELLVMDEEPKNTIVIDDDGEVTFSINTIPGAPADLVLDDDDDESKSIESEPEEITEATETDGDVWGWEKSHGIGKFIAWLKSMIENVPSHSGSDTTGVERAIAYFERLNGEISRAMRRDFKKEIDAAKAEEARTMIEDGIKRLTDRLERLREKKFKKSRKKAGFESGNLVKTAETSFTGGITVNVPYFISFVARTCIDASVQAGKDMKETFIKLSSEYKLDKREKVQVIQLIKDMGYPLVMDRIRINEGKLELKDKDGEFMAQFPA